MSNPDDFVLLSRVGQTLRGEGLTLRHEAVTRAIHKGKLGALRLGGRWAIRMADARAFSVPLAAATENS